MPEYLSPGTYIEELPPQLRAIEGVSTSTAGFVGVTQRGPAPGFVLPFDPQPAGPNNMVVALAPDPTPVLVTSFADFTRQFGNPLQLPDPTNNSYLGYAVQAFFANGGLRAYIARVIPTTATYGGFGLSQGAVFPLAASVPVAPAVSTDTLTFTALRGIANGQSLSFFHKDGSPVLNGATPLSATVLSYTSATSQIKFTAAITVPLKAGDVYAAPTGGTLASGPFFWARNPGQWSSLVSAQVTPTRRRTVAISGVPTTTEIQVASTSGFYVGAIVEIDTGAQQFYVVVSSIAAGSLVLTQPLGVAVNPAATFTPTARITEIDITLMDASGAVPVTETFSGLTWNPDAAVSVRFRHYSTVINAQSSLVYVQPPGVGTINGNPFGGSEDATLASQPTTFNGLAVSITSATNATNSIEGALTSVSEAVASLEADLTGLAAALSGSGTVAGSPFLATANTDLNALNTAVVAAAAVPVPRSGPGAGLGAAIAPVNVQATAVSTAAATALIALNNNPVDPTGALATAQGAIPGNITTMNATITTATTAATSVANGVVIGDDGGDAQETDYIGVDNGPGHRSGIQALQDADDISIIAAPGQTDQSIQNELINQCELLKYRFAVLDGEQVPAGDGSVNAILAHRDNYDSSYAAYYSPWFKITQNNQDLYLPPSGHIVGIYAGTDNERGVWKAPANVVVQNITGLKFYLTKGEQDILNPAGVNVTRRFTATGTRVWGARTISSDSSLKYINVRRTLIFLEDSIDQGTQWVVFEPNTPDTWDRLTDSITAFLTTQWRNGALFGLKVEDSFFVRCDETTMTADDIQNGRLICQIGVAIVRPAEFVIFRIEQTTGYANQ
jgi:phage tail sheath protein FI